MNDVDGNIKQELAADGSNSGVEKEPYVEDSYNPYPFDSEKISIFPKRISLSNVIRRWERGLIHAADLQRRANLWDEGKKSRLIESLMLKIPLPLFYASANKDDQLFIVDGLQRLSAIKGYVQDVQNKKYKLKSLEFLKELEGKSFDEIPERMQIRINETELDFAIIGPDSPPEVQRNIFKRLNTGGLPLTEQEIRHALYFGPVTNLLAELVDTYEFQTAVDFSIKDSRMAGQELILRFLAFSIMNTSQYKKDDEMDSFLSDAMQILNKLIDPGNHSKSNTYLFMERNHLDISKDDIKQKFITAMTRAKKLFKSHAFRITIPAKNKTWEQRSPVNKSLFELWSVILSNISQEDFDILNENKELLFEKLDAEFYYKDSVLPGSIGFLRNYIGKDSLKITGVKGRYKITEKIIASIIEERKNDKYAIA